MFWYVFVSIGFDRSKCSEKEAHVIWVFFHKRRWYKYRKVIPSCGFKRKVVPQDEGGRALGL